jgi:vacuolar-type H+-ATPase subunit H
MEAEKSMLKEIRITEEECNRRLKEARIEAEQLISAASKEAKPILERAEKEGDEIARQYCEDEMKKILSEIETLKDNCTQQLETVRKAGEKNLPDAMQKIISTVAFE